MKIAVTGGSGFVGKHLVDTLIQEGHEVIILDKVDPEDDRLTWINIDFNDLDGLVKALDGIEIVYHLGAIADASLAYKNYKLTFDVNVIGTYNVLEACRINNVKKIIYSSTIWVYNAADVSEVNEETLFTNNTQHVYTTTKFFGEYLCYDFANMYNLDFTILRFGIPYGPGSEFNVIPIFIRRALNKESLTIRGSGEQKRQFIFVKDLAGGCVSAISNKADNGIFNLVGNEMISVKQVANTVSALIPDTVVEFIPEREGELGYRFVSPKKSKKILGWEATTPFEEGVQKTIDWYKTNL